jgi:hypothetical protein
MRFTGTVLMIFSCAFYLYVLVQFRREELRSRRKSSSRTIKGSSGEPTASSPVKPEDRFDA